MSLLTDVEFNWCWQDDHGDTFTQLGEWLTERQRQGYTVLLYLTFGADPMAPGQASLFYLRAQLRFVDRKLARLCKLTFA